MILGLVILLLILVLFYMFYNSKCTCPSCTAPVVPKTENMIAANTIARFSRGYNGLNTGGSYSDAMNQLHEAEVMSLATVETDMNSMNGDREPNS